MAVCADDQIPRKNNSLFRKKGMLYAYLTNLIVVGKIMLTCKFSHDLALFG